MAENISHRGNSMCRSLEEGGSLALLEKRKEAGVARAEGTWERGTGADGSREAGPGHTGPCRPQQGVWILL